jgi:hypothetical protein
MVPLPVQTDTLTGATVGTNCPVRNFPWRWAAAGLQLCFQLRIQLQLALLRPGIGQTPLTEDTAYVINLASLRLEKSNGALDGHAGRWDHGSPCKRGNSETTGSTGRSNSPLRANAKPKDNAPYVLHKATDS